MAKVMLDLPSSQTLINVPLNRDEEKQVWLSCYQALQSVAYSSWCNGEEIWWFSLQLYFDFVLVVWETIAENWGISVVTAHLSSGQNWPLSQSGGVASFVAWSDLVPGYDNLKWLPSRCFKNFCFFPCNDLFLLEGHDWRSWKPRRGAQVWFLQPSLDSRSSPPIFLQTGKWSLVQLP